MPAANRCQDGRVDIRVAAPAEYGAVGELTVREYLDGGHVRAESPYVESLRDTERRAREAMLLVAVEGGEVLGAVAFAPGGSEYANVAGPGEAEFRTLVVSGSARRRGIGAALVRECVRLAMEAGAGVLRLSSGPTMVDAQRMYERLGFVRTPDRDWSPSPTTESVLLTYELALGYCDRCGKPLAEATHTGCQAARELEPPRWCARCRRRMVVQVTPTGWTARCIEHGELVG
jgi:predicted N-acetyltransferase YhbS